jgi:hypothetical protein
MKTVKTLFILLALVIAGNSFGQTKEETIEWLKTKGLLNFKVTNDSKGTTKSCRIMIVNENIYFIYEATNKNWNTTEPLKASMKVALEDILYEDVTNINTKISDENDLPKTYFEIFV